MGEAKRRKAMQKDREFTTGDGRTVVVRNAGDAGEVFENFLAMNQDIKHTSNVPCGTCRACCYHAGVDIYPMFEDPENLKHLSYEPREDGKLYLRTREDGACVHLGEKGCTVYEHRPNACRSYDCRVFALFGVLDAYESGHKQPFWSFDNSTETGKMVEAACRILGLFEMRKRTQDGQEVSAIEIARAVGSNPKRFYETMQVVAELKEKVLPSMTKAEKAAVVKMSDEEAESFVGQKLTKLKLKKT